MKILREPLFHFFVIGALIFAAYNIINGKQERAPNELLITAGRVESLAATFTRVWNRPPSANELEGLIQNYIQEEILYREALQFGLDRDDTIIRRRLRQKMEFISQDLAEQIEPSDNQLRDYLQNHLEQFAREPLFTFQQIFLDRERHGKNLIDEAKQLLTHLRETGEEVALTHSGDPFLLDNNFEKVSTSEVQGLFGETFALKLQALTLGQWSGPVESEYGLHLVFMSAVEPGRAPELAEVRNEVQREWAYVQRQKLNNAFYENLRQGYTVKVDYPPFVDLENKIMEARR